MPIDWKPATIDGTGLWVSLSGASRSGKTVSALRLARGIAGPDGKIFAIDTEGRRMSHHAKKFNFTVFNMESPFEPVRFAEVAESAQEAGAAALICDSFSLEWNGIGGVLDRFEKEFARRGKQEKHRNACWAFAKEPHREMRNRLMSLTMPIIFCSRLNAVPEHLGGGFKVEQDQRWLYEWTVAITLHADAPGMPNYTMKDKDGQFLFKMTKDLEILFPPKRFIGEAAGEGLQAWRNGKPVVLRAEDQIGEDKQRDQANRLIERLRNASSTIEVDRLLHDQGTLVWRQRLAETRPELESDIKAATLDTYDRLLPPRDDASEPSDDREAA